MVWEQSGAGHLAPFGNSKLVPQEMEKICPGSVRAHRCWSPVWGTVERITVRAQGVGKATSSLTPKDQSQLK